jgi:hypothetical protein
MAHIAVVGCGFIGSLFTEEYLKLAYAGELPHRLTFVDGDQWEPRNAANQNIALFTARQREAKAESMTRLAESYDRQATAVVTRLTDENIDTLLENVDLLVDAVDNLATRHLLYNYGVRHGIPVLHLGLDALMGAGQVEWNYEDHDTFGLSPLRLVGKTPPADPESGVQPPCELVRMRAAGWHVAYMAAVATALYYGFDPLGYLAEEAPCHGYLTEWATTAQGYMPVRATWERASERLEVSHG